MWCRHCGVSVQHADASVATKHLNSANHKRRKRECSAINLKPGATAPVADAPAPTTTAPAQAHAAAGVQRTTSLVESQQASMRSMLDSLNMTANISDDFVAAFLQAGMAPNKLGHPSLRGLVAKYTQVKGSLSTGSTLYRNAARVGATHLAAVRAKLKEKQVWVPLDEWTDSQGNAICNIILGTGKEAWVVATHTLLCKGPNNGVEHTEVA